MDFENVFWFGAVGSGHPWAPSRSAW